MKLPELSEASPFWLPLGIYLGLTGRVSLQHLRPSVEWDTFMPIAFD